MLKNVLRYLRRLPCECCLPTNLLVFLAAEHDPKEHLLHIAVRLGLVHLACFLIHQRRAESVLMSPYEDEEEPPLQLDQRNGICSMFRTLAE